MNIENELKQFNTSIEGLKSKRFETFNEMEYEYCNIINQGNKIRNFIIKNPSLCSENSYKVLTNQTQDTSLLEDKYRSLLHLAYLIRDLFEKYSIYVEQLKSEQKYEEAINIYQQMFKLSKNPLYKQQIANIKYQIFNETEESYLIYKELEELMINDKNFWWQFSDIYKAKKDIYNQVLCIKNALDLEGE